MAPNNHVRRRAFLGTVGAAFVGLAGCSGSPDSSQTETETGTPTPAPETTTPRPTTTNTTEPPTETPAQRGPPEWVAAAGELYDDFALFDQNWRVDSGAASLVEGEGFGGHPGVRMETSDRGLARIERKYWQPQDFSNTEFSFAVKIEETTESAATVTLQLQDIEGREMNHTDEIPSAATGEWVRIDAGTTDADRFDLSQLTHVRIEHFARDSGETTLLVSDVRTHPAREKGAVVFALEDDHETNVTLAAPVLREAGYAGGVFASPDRLGSSGESSVEDYRTLSDAGWDIGVNTLGHNSLSSYGSDERAAVEEAIARLQSKGFDGALNVFRAPHGDYTAATLGYAPDLFDMTFTGVGRSAGTNSAISDPRTVLSLDADDLEKARTAVEAAATHRQTAVLFFHARHIESREAFADLVGRVQRLESEGALEVLTPTELAARTV
ncbi:polysaccharide deacetylase family protein [Halomarina oriensis]|nr:polysaccharide deacetylase family protein [Halomarina oriensis]